MIDAYVQVGRKGKRRIKVDGIFVLDDQRGMIMAQTENGSQEGKLVQGR